MPKYINPYTDSGFKKLSDGELANLTAEQKRAYEENLIHYWGMKSAIQTAVEEALETKSAEIARNLLALGLDNNTIAQATGLTIAQIEKLRNV